LVSFVQGSWYGPWAGRSFDLIVSNPPYIAGLDGHLERGDLRFEPRAALTDASADGLASLHTLIDGAARHLEPGGAIWLEHGFDQGPACRARLLAAGFVSVSTRRDLAGNERVSGGLWPENAQA
jgi:release factor glutamine methyltransferase